MDKLISQTTLDKFYREELKKNGKERIEQIKDEQKFKHSLKEKTSIFLCHSHLDKTTVNKIVMLFANLNIDIYVDWMDSTLPKKTDKSTASAIKRKINESDKFLFLATYNALRSKWCNWELGLAYSSKGESDFAILPIESRSGNWIGSEYLQLYPEMKIDIENNRIESLTSYDIKINYFDEKKITLNEWIKRPK